MTSASVEGVEWPFDINLDGAEDGKLMFSFVCRECGGWEMTLRDGEEGDMRMAHCAACGIWWGRMARIRLRMIMEAQAAGYDVSAELEKVRALGAPR